MGKESVISTIKQPVAWLIERWDQFFFQPVDSLPLCILRILCGCMLLYTHLIWGTALTDFLGDSGWNTPDLVAQLRGGGTTPSLWWYVPAEWMNASHWCCNLIIVLFILGLGGRLTALLTWLIAISYAHRANLANFGLDQTNCILAFYLMIGPSTQYLSLDRWLAKRKIGLSRLGLGRLNNDLSPSANVALRLVQLHLCIIYLWAGLGKLQGDAWWTGEAIWLALANQEYQSMDMTWLASYPRLLELLTHATIFWELSFSALVWPKATRWIVLGIGAMMHLGIGAFLGMWTFGSIMIFSYVSFASAAWLRKQVGLFATQESEMESTPPPVATPATDLTTTALANTLASIPDDTLTSVTDESSAALSAREKTVILITPSQRCVDHFLQVNQLAEVNWVVVPSIKEAESLVPLVREATFLLLEMRTLESTDLQYLSIRVVRAKKCANKISPHETESSSKRAFPK